MYDVVVLGAGVAGSYLCQMLRKQGVSFVLIDKNRQFKDDSGIVSAEFLDLMEDVLGENAGKKLIRSKIDIMKIVSSKKISIKLKSEKPFAYLVNRELLEDNLHSGISIAKENAWKIDFFSDHCHVWTDKNDYKCRMVIGADGANSFVRNQAGLPRNDNVSGVLFRSKKKITESDCIEVFLNKNYSKDYFAWYVPKNKELGVIFGPKSDKKQCIENLKEDFDITDADMVSSPIPIGFSKTYSDRCLLVGDAGSQTKPLTAGGIVFSMKCAKHAAKVIQDAVETGDFSRLHEYEELWKHDIGKAIKKQLSFRKIYYGMNNRDIENVFDMVVDDFEDTEIVNYDNPMELWNSLSKSKKTRLALKGVKGMIKNTLF
ncbi:hypothetical protein CL614_06260 [archaeon]|nr:hypothetical protein [archaeon]